MSRVYALDAPVAIISIVIIVVVVIMGFEQKIEVGGKQFKSEDYQKYIDFLSAISLPTKILLLIIIMKCGCVVKCMFCVLNTILTIMFGAILAVFCAIIYFANANDVPEKETITKTLGIALGVLLIITMIMCKINTCIQNRYLVF